MSESYTKSNLILELAQAHRLSRRRTEALLNALAEIAYREALNGFTVPGICRLDVVHRKARRARNPQSGETLLIGEHDILRVRPVKRAKMRVAPTPPGLITVLPPSPEPAAAVPAPAAAVPAEMPTPVAPTAAPAAPPAPMPPAPAAAVQQAVAPVPVLSAAVTPPAAAPPIEPRMFSFKCPYCAAIIEVTEDCVGERANCPSCNKTFAVPAPKGSQRKPQGAQEEQFVSFLCKSCSQEIEAPVDMAGSQSECPSCSAIMIIPYVSEPGTSQALRAAGADSKTVEAYKSRTIRIELPDDA
jgi:nucleoid DNA-binding protein/DNA-directed RNA polymerase subunit RPC12/RpoP